MNFDIRILSHASYVENKWYCYCWDVGINPRLTEKHVLKHNQLGPVYPAFPNSPVLSLCPIGPVVPVSSTYWVVYEGRSLFMWTGTVDLLAPSATGATGSQIGSWFISIYPWLANISYLIVLLYVVILIVTCIVMFIFCTCNLHHIIESFENLKT